MLERWSVFAALCLLAAAATAAPKVEDSIAQRAMACTLCHGKEGRASAEGYYPRIAGKPQGYLYRQLLNFRDGRRDYGLMSDLIAPLGDAYLEELAGYFAALELPYPAPQAPTLDAGQLALARRLVQQGDAQRALPACVQCHGQTLSGLQPAIPGLLGLPRDYLNGQLGAWRAGQRRAQAPDCMAQIAKQLRPDEINAISQWLASRPVPADYHAAPAHEHALPLQCGDLR